jgi:glycosyltransferase involved in cell wall biosynthesis
MIAEAMAFGKPVVATRVGGIPELIDDGKTGFLVDRGDIDAAAEKVLRLLEDPELRKTLGCAGRQKTHAKFNLQTNVGELIRVYGL